MTVKLGGNDPLGPSLATPMICSTWDGIPPLFRGPGSAAILAAARTCKMLR